MSHETPSQVDLVVQLYDENQKLKERIKRMNEASDWVCNWIADHKHLIDDINKPLNKLRKAKDAKS